jgi:hypothetical protein
LEVVVLASDLLWLRFLVPIALVVVLIAALTISWCMRRLRDRIRAMTDRRESTLQMRSHVS